MTTDDIPQNTPAYLTFQVELISLQSLLVLASAGKQLLQEPKGQGCLPGSNGEEHLGSLESLRKAVGVGDALSEMLLCRYVDNFHCYLADVIHILFRVHPEILRSSESVTIKEVLEAQSMEDFVDYLSEKKVDSLSHLGFVALNRYLEERVGIVPAVADAVSADVVLAVSMRNIIVHRRGRVSRRYLAENGFEAYRVGQRVELSIQDSIRYGKAIVEMAKAIDAALIDKFGDECFHKYCESEHSA